MNIITSSLELLVPLLINAAKRIIDAFVNGATLSDDGKRTIVSAYVESKIWLQKLVDSSETSYDDQALKTFLELCEDTASEAGFQLPSVPEF